ncbi:MAG: hypothetical protein H8E21_14460 [Gammaproteobacteria bacterium]|nr:hypothetical protein [Gammaproteobacteria bacterium]MBL7000377.1 hypothetical protein [Gammaproteobacteria bacterium]
MNEDNIQNFIQQTEEYIRMNHQYLSAKELASLTELYDELNDELARKKVFDD